MVEPDQVESPALVFPPEGEDRAALLRRDQRTRWLRGERLPVETYLRAENGIDGAIPDAELSLLLIHGEFLLRQELGESPTIDEYLVRFPDHAERLKMADAFHRVVSGEGGPDHEMSPAAPSPPGYAILGELGRGGMGIVYKAHQRSLDRVVAVKMIRLGALAGAADLRRFQLEAEAAAKLDHPNIVPIYEVGQAGDLPFFSMKLMEGGSLEDLIGGSVDDPRAAARLVASVALSVHHAHQHGILHRDLKPANVLLDAMGQPHVGDFGLARSLEGDSSLTQDGTILGTPSYMAPEQATSTPGQVTTAADIYSLGSILFRALDRTARIQGGDSDRDAPAGHRRRAGTAPRAQPEDRPRSGGDLLEGAEKQPKRRYPRRRRWPRTWRWLAGQPIRARRIGRRERVWKWARRHPAIAALCGLLMLVASAGVTGMFVLYGQTVVARSFAVAQATKALEALQSSEASLYTNRIALAERLPPGT